MARKILKKGEELNGSHGLKNGDFIQVQYYPGVGKYYGIINNNPALQMSLSLGQLQKLLKQFCSNWSEVGYK